MAALLSWANYTPPTPKQLGVHRLENVPLADIAEFIDWSPFFNAWELFGKYPKILDDAIVGEGEGRTKKSAQQAAAAEALRRYGAGGVLGP
jgi:5-methyltetrahydrofolate--homocysteine methyltransferase